MCTNIQADNLYYPDRITLLLPTAALFIITKLDSAVESPSLPNPAFAYTYQLHSTQPVYVGIPGIPGIPGMPTWYTYYRQLRLSTCPLLSLLLLFGLELFTVPRGFPHLLRRFLPCVQTRTFQAPSRRPPIAAHFLFGLRTTQKHEFHMVATPSVSRLRQRPRLDNRSLSIIDRAYP